MHHIHHIEDRPDLALVDWNLVGLCNNCHNQEHPEKLKRVEVDRKEDIISGEVVIPPGQKKRTTKISGDSGERAGGQETIQKF